MRKISIALAALSFSVSAFAAEPEIPRNATVYSAEGTKIGKIDRVVPAADGAESQIRIIYRGKFISIPASTLSAGEKGLVTSLTNTEIKKL